MFCFYQVHHVLALEVAQVLREILFAIFKTVVLTLSDIYCFNIVITMARLILVITCDVGDYHRLVQCLNVRNRVQVYLTR